MTPEAVAVEGAHPHSVRIVASGGKETDPMWASNISDEDFVEALANCIEATGVFATVVRDAEGGDYLLEVAIVDVEQPAMGFNMSVTITTSWSLTEVASGKLVFQEFLDTERTATLGDSLSGVNRLRVANEMAARANIHDGVLLLSQLQLGATP